MGKLFIVISDEVERKFRMKVVKKFGGKKGALGKAVEEAIVRWLKYDDDDDN